MGAEIAKCLTGPVVRRDGCLETKDGIVTWGFGHILRQAEPEVYDARYKMWRAEDLPIVPGEWKLLVDASCAKQFAIVDAGMTDLIRPALYQAYHKIENISSDEPVETYDVVGPICESSDVFGKAVDINKAHRGDLIALRSAGAYGEIMASQYNCRQLPKGYITEDF